MRAALAVIVIALVSTVVHAATESTPAEAPARRLLQSGVSCPAQIPACMPRRCTTRILDSREQYVCLRCMKGYVPARGSDGRSIVQCVCPAGTYQVGSGSSRECKRCDRGFYCPGGDTKAKQPDDLTIGGRAIACTTSGDGLTTKSEGATKYADCVARAGFVLPPVRGAAAVRCEGSTYAPENNRLKNCLPCQSGLEAPPGLPYPRKNKVEVCQVPPGRFWELNVVRDCPQGMYRDEYVTVTMKAAIACLNCPPGWTTASKAATSKSECNKLQPGFMLSTATPGDPAAVLPQDADISAALECPYGYYNDATAMACMRCPLDTITRVIGAQSVNDCLVPPGYYVKLSSPTEGELTKCPTNIDGTGYYRAGWVAPKEATEYGDGSQACTPCGEGILSEYRDFDEIGEPAVIMKNKPTEGLVASSPASCYIEAGWGMTFDPQNPSKYKAQQCPSNSYGVSERIYGLNFAPCKACTKNLYSATGSTTMEECKNPVGFGYTSEGANQCPPDFYTSGDTMEPCTQCPEGRYTEYEPGNGVYQASIYDCKVPSGHGVFTAEEDNPWSPSDPQAYMVAKPCPIGFYSQGDVDISQPTTNPVCQRCPAGSSTSDTGSTTCDVCAPGYGIPSSKPVSTDTADCELCALGTYHPGGGLRCLTCPRTPFNHPLGNTYVSDGITFSKGLTGPETCVPKHAQLPAPAGHRMALNESLFQVTSAADHVECIQKCSQNQCCVAQFEEGGTCKHVSLPAVGPEDTGPKLYYKLPPSELIAAASVNETKLWAKTQPAGVYTRCSMSKTWVDLAELGLIGTSTNPTLVEETDLSKTIEWQECADELACRQKCEANAACWGFIFVPGKGWATRGGEDQIGVRTFVVSPDLSRDLSREEGAIVPTPPAVCPPGKGEMWNCTRDCPANTWNDGTLPYCEGCTNGTVSPIGSTSSSQCTVPPPTECPAGYGGLPACTTQCQPGTYNPGSWGECKSCPAGYNSAAAASNCTVIVPPTCPAGKGKGSNDKCNLCCKSVQQYNDGTSDHCMSCGDGKRPNRNGTGCVDIITSCEPGKALNPAGDGCDVTCPKGKFQNGSYVTCITCPSGMTSDTGAADCYYEVCPQGYGSTPKCETPCTGGTYSNGRMTSCQQCPGGRTSVDGVSCIFVRCPKGLGGENCDISCKGAGKYNDGLTNGTACKACPGQKTSLDGETCVFTNCPAGKQGNNCDQSCQGNTYNDGKSERTTCIDCPRGMTSVNGIKCIYAVCNRGYQGDDCTDRCPEGTFNAGASNQCRPCPANQSPNLDRSACVPNTCPAGKGVNPNTNTCTKSCDEDEFQDGSSNTCRTCASGASDNSRKTCVTKTKGKCVIYKASTSSKTITFDCPSGWAKKYDNSYNSPPRCITTSSSGSCQDLLASAVGGQDNIAPGTQLVNSADSIGGKVVCRCSNSGDGEVLKLVNGKWSCVKEAVFLPKNHGNNQEQGGDSPNLGVAGNMGVWYDLLPNQSCDSAQSCWDMCFFCDGRPRYHQDFTAALQTSSMDVQEVKGCTNDKTCKLADKNSQSAKHLYEACRQWGQETMWWGNNLASLRSLYRNGADNRWHNIGGSDATDDPTETRIWPTRPNPSGANSNQEKVLNLWGIKGSGSEWTESTAETIDKALVLFGPQ